MTSLADLAATLGHEPQPAQWPASGRDPVPMDLFGKDHWSTFAFVESRTVDHGGVLDHDRMRCSAEQHPWMMSAKKRLFAGMSADASRHPSIVKGDGPDAQGHYTRGEIAGHDDYDCLDDLVAAGLLAVAMPGTDGDGWYLDRHGRVLHFDGEPYQAGFLTGLAEKLLSAHAVWSLTEYGVQVASALRVFKANGGMFHDFTAPPPAR